MEYTSRLFQPQDRSRIATRSQSRQSDAITARPEDSLALND